MQRQRSVLTNSVERRSDVTQRRIQIFARSVCGLVGEAANSAASRLSQYQGQDTRSAPVRQAIRVIAHGERWPTLFAAQASALRESLADAALRIDHIGSTAVPGLAAKPIIDVQISVAAFEPLDAFRAPLERLGYVFRADNTERTKRYFREPPGSQRTRIHVRRAGSFSEQLACCLVISAVRTRSRPSAIPR
jgi:hypothetical protein